MLLLCWNVAGLATTVQRIHEHYHKDAQDQKCSNALHYYWAHLHQADIVCLQEHKIPADQLSNRCEPRNASRIPEYESFWSCCTDAQKKGLNGVVTYARHGVASVDQASAAALGIAHLDRQGRCVVTHHPHLYGGVWIWNVYVPASSNGYAAKLEFLTALRSAVQRKRVETNEPQLIVGDLNISHTKLDVPWNQRSIRIDTILQQVQEHHHLNSKSDPDLLPQWKIDVAQNWSTIEETLQTAQAVPTKTTNTLTQQQFEKFRLQVTLPNGHKTYLGKHEIAADHCWHEYELSAHTYLDEDGDNVVAKEANTLSVQILAELMQKFVQVQWSEATLRDMAETDGDVCQFSPSRKWLHRLLHEDDMMDPFRYFYPTAQARFTCWHQFTNQRYCNHGIRIDYTLIDRCLLDRVERGPVSTLRCGSRSQDSKKKKDDTLTDSPKADHTDNIDPLGEQAALQAATANGRFQPVSFEGGGISQVPKDVLDTQFGEPHTGIVYTPPSFSDHVAISLLLQEEETSNNRQPVVLKDDAATRKAQPHKKQKTIASFFQKQTTCSTTGSSETSTAVKRTLQSVAVASNKKVTKPKSKNSILYHFKKLEK